MSNPKSMPWSDEHLLGYGPMDDTHKEFVSLLDAVLGCEDREFCERLEAFERHAVAHFAEEDAWMERTGFPPKACHIDEHAAVLLSVRRVLELVKQGDVAEGRRLAAGAGGLVSGPRIPSRLRARPLDGEAQLRRQTDRAAP